MKISYSALSTYKQCPLQYKYSYIDRLPKKESHYLFFGSLIHEALHEMLKGIKARTLPEVLAYYNDNWQDKDFLATGEKPEVWRDKGQQIITNFYNNFDPTAQSVLVTEDYFKVPIADGHELSGIIDRLDRVKDQSNDEILEVIDYKTGKVGSQTHIHDNLQLTIYYHAIRSRFPDIKDIRLTLYFLEPQVKQSTFRDSGHVERMQTEVVGVINKIGQQDFEPKINNLCPWCDFKEICPAYIKERPGRGWPEADTARRAILEQATGIKSIDSPKPVAAPSPKKTPVPTPTNGVQETMF